MRPDTSQPFREPPGPERQEAVPLPQGGVLGWRGAAFGVCHPCHARPPAQAELESLLHRGRGSGRGAERTEEGAGGGLGWGLGAS